MQNHGSYAAICKALCIPQNSDRASPIRNTVAPDRKIILRGPGPSARSEVEPGGGGTRPGPRGAESWLGLRAEYNVYIYNLTAGIPITHPLKFQKQQHLSVLGHDAGWCFCFIDCLAARTVHSLALRESFFMRLLLIVADDLLCETKGGVAATLPARRAIFFLR